MNSQVLRETVLEYRRGGKTVLFSTHIMEHAEKLCDRLCIIARGKKLIDGSLTEVKRTHGGQHVIVAFDGAMYLGAMPLPEILDSLIAAKRTPPTVAVLFDNGAPPGRISDLANSQRFAATRCAPRRGRSRPPCSSRAVAAGGNVSRPGMAAASMWIRSGTGVFHGGNCRAATTI